MVKFKFTGTLNAVWDSTKKGFYDKNGITKDGHPYESVTFIINSAKNNAGFVELFGQEQEVIKKWDENGNPLPDIQWANRFDKNTVSDLPAFGKNVISFEKDKREEFASPYDAVVFIKQNLSAYKGKDVTITGDVKANIYNGDITDRFQIHNIFPASENDKKRLSIAGEFFYEAEDIDLDSWNTDHVVTIHGYTKEYISQGNIKGNRYLPKTIIFDAGKINWDNERESKLAIFKLKQVGITASKSSAKVTLSNSRVYKISARLSYINGNEEVPFDENMLTANQKEAIALGLKTIEDFKPNGTAYGDRITIYKLFDFDLRTPFENGYVALDDTKEEFERLIYSPGRQISSNISEKEEEDTLDEEMFFD
jgi:hypothetical protein